MNGPTMPDLPPLSDEKSRERMAKAMEESMSNAGAQLRIDYGEAFMFATVFTVCFFAAVGIIVAATKWAISIWPGVF